MTANFGTDEPDGGHISCERFNSQVVGSTIMGKLSTDEASIRMCAATPLFERGIPPRAASVCS